EELLHAALAHERGHVVDENQPVVHGERQASDVSVGALPAVRTLHGMFGCVRFSHRGSLVGSVLDDVLLTLTIAHQPLRRGLSNPAATRGTQALSTACAAASIRSAVTCM